MRHYIFLAILGLLAACSGIETQPADTATFVAGHYKYYAWRNPPLKNVQRSNDPIYLMDGMIRREVDSVLAGKGYVLDAGQAQFKVDYLQAMGLQQGVQSQDANGGIDPIPSARPNRQINQAMVDNAYALAGLRATYNIALLFTDAASHDEVWRVLITKIVEDANQADPKKMQDAIRAGVREGLKYLPDAT